jgi:hypothetical protein
MVKRVRKKATQEEAQGDIGVGPAGCEQFSVLSVTFLAPSFFD